MRAIRERIFIIHFTPPVNISQYVFPAMPTTKAAQKTAPEILRDRLGDRLCGLYVVPRDPVSGETYDPFGLVAVVDMDLEGAYRIGGTLSTLLLEHGVDVPMTVEPKGEITLPSEALAI